MEFRDKGVLQMEFNPQNGFKVSTSCYPDFSEEELGAQRGSWPNRAQNLGLSVSLQRWLSRGSGQGTRRWPGNRSGTTGLICQDQGENWMQTGIAACGGFKICSQALQYFSLCFCCLAGKSCPTLLWPHGLQPARFLCPWDFPGKNTGVDCHLSSPGYLPDPEIKPMAPALAGRFFTTEQPGKPIFLIYPLFIHRWP